MGIQNPFQLDVVSVRLVRDAPIFFNQKITSPESAIAVVGGDNNSYFSFKEKELLKMPKVTLTQNYQYLDFGVSAMVAEQGRSR